MTSIFYGVLSNCVIEVQLDTGTQRATVTAIALGHDRTTLSAKHPMRGKLFIHGGCLIVQPDSGGQREYADFEGFFPNVRDALCRMVRSNFNSEEAVHVITEDMRKELFEACPNLFPLTKPVPQRVQGIFLLPAA